MLGLSLAVLQRVCISLGLSLVESEGVAVAFSKRESEHLANDEPNKAPFVLTYARADAAHRQRRVALLHVREVAAIPLSLIHI